jgi:hypothetical protein
MSYSADPLNKKSNNENASYTDDAPHQECPNASEMAVGGVSGAPTPSTLDVRDNAAGREAPRKHGKPQKQCA